MTRPRTLATALIAATAIILLAAGPVMIFKGFSGQSQVKQELTAQHIQFPKTAATGLPKSLSSYAGVTVTTGPQAKAFSDMMEVHVLEATNGRSYSQVSAQWIAGGRKDAALGALRQTAFSGETLRGSLMGAYQAWEITWLVIGLGALLTGIGVVTGVGVFAFRPRRVVVPASAEALESKHLVTH